MAPSQRPFYIALGVVVVGGIIFIATRLTSGAPLSIPANVVITAADTSGFRGYELGLPSAPVEVTEYGDLECPVCASWATVQFPDVKARLIDAGKVRWRYRDFPLDGAHRHPRVAAHAAACANDQGKYWPAQEAMFARQTDYALASDPMPVLSDIMKSVGVDLGAWNTCMQSKKYAGRIQASEEEASKLGANGTPTFVINGRMYDNRLGSDQLAKLVDSLTAAAPATPVPSKPTGGQ